MSEENKEVTDEAQVEATPEVTSTVEEARSASEMTDVPVQSEVEHIMKMAESNPAIKDLPEYQNMMKTVEKVRQEQKNENTSEQSSTEEEVEEVAEEKEVVNENENVSENEGDLDNPFGIGDSSKSEKNLSFENEGDFKAHLEKKYAIKDYGKFLSSVDKWRNSSQKAVEVEEQYSTLVNGLGSLPQPIKDAIDAFANAKDYREAFVNSTPQIDFSREANEIDKEKIVSHYFKAKIEKNKGKLEEGEIYQEEYDEFVDDLYDSAQRLFKSDKKDWERERADVIKQQEDKAAALKSTAISSVDSLKQKYPNFSSNELKKVRTRLVQQDLNNLFFDKNGNYRADAAERIAFVLYGDKLMTALSRKSKAEGESSANADIVQRGKKKLVGSKSREGVNKTDAQNAVSHLNGQFSKSTYS